MAGTIGIPFALVLGTGLLHAPAAHAAIFIPGTFPALTALLGILLLARAGRGSQACAGVGLTVAGVGLTALSALQGMRRRAALAAMRCSIWARGCGPSTR